MATAKHNQSTWVEWDLWAPGADGPLASLAGMGVRCNLDGEWVPAGNRTPTHTIKEQEHRGDMVWVRISPRAIVIDVEVTLIPTDGSPRDINAARLAVRAYLFGVEVTSDGDTWVVEDVD